MHSDIFKSWEKVGLKANGTTDLFLGFVKPDKFNKRYNQIAD